MYLPGMEILLWWLSWLLGAAVGLIIGWALAQPKRKVPTSLICGSIIINNFKTSGNIMATQFPVQEYAKTAFKIKRDDTGEILDPVAAQIKFTNETFSGYDTAVVNVVVDAQDTPEDAILDVQGIGVGETDILFGVDGSYIDPITEKVITKHFEASIHVAVTAGETPTSLVVDLGEPQPIPSV